MPCYSSGLPIGCKAPFNRTTPTSVERDLVEKQVAARFKVPFIATISFISAGQPIRQRLDLFKGFTSYSIAKRPRTTLLSTALIPNVWLACFAAVTDAGCDHMPKVAGTLKPRDLPKLESIYNSAGKLQTALAGASKALKIRKYVQT